MGIDVLLIQELGVAKVIFILKVEMKINRINKSCKILEIETK